MTCFLCRVVHEERKGFGVNVCNLSFRLRAVEGLLHGLLLQAEAWNRCNNAFDSNDCVERAKRLHMS